MLTGEEKTITVAIAEKSDLVRSGIRKTIDNATSMKVVGEARDDGELKELIQETHPSVLLREFGLPGEDPYLLQIWIHERSPETRTILLTNNHTSTSMAKMLSLNVVGFLHKNLPEEELTEAIRRAARGEILFTQEQMQKVNEWKENVESKLNALSPREHEILKMLAKGLDNKTIAAALDMSAKTAAYHVTNVLKKICLKSRQEATVWAIKNLPDNLE